MISASGVELRQKAAGLFIIIAALPAPVVEGADCNENCIVDAEEVLQQFVEDCNANGIPDECDLKLESAAFVQGPFLATVGPTGAMRTVDLDDDGWPDLVTVELNTSAGLLSGLSFHFNDGSGKLEPPISIVLPATYPQTIDVADLEGDGDVDVVAVVRVGVPCEQRPDRVTILENLGRRTFAAPVSLDGGTNTRSLVAADVDGDGDQDLVIGEAGPLPSLAGAIGIFFNRGDATFEPASRLKTPEGYPDDIDAADLDGDGDVDLAAVHDNASSFPQIFRNRGDGTFDVPEQLHAAPHLSSVLADDLDSDGDVDLVMTRTNASPSIVLVLENPGGGSAWVDRIVEVVGVLYSAAAVDLEGDGRHEILSARGILEVMHLVTGAASSNRYTVLGNGVRLVASADMDKDGDEDVIAGSGEALSVIENEGGDLVAPFSLLDGAADPAIADLDGDLDLDLVAPTTEGIALVRNAGGRTFPIHDLHHVPETRLAHSLVTGDLDADGDQDLVALEKTGRIGVYRNPGDGRFLDLHQRLFLEDPSLTKIPAIALADLDGDGDLDVTTTLQRFHVSLFLNTGDGTLLAGPRLVVGSDPSTLLAADLDRDGLADLLTGNVELSPPSVSVLANRGGGVFLTARNYAVDAVPTWLEAGDIDADGDVDVATNGIILLENRGDGAFHGSRNVQVREACSGDLADLDGDGDLDLASGNDLFLNRGDGRFDVEERAHPPGGCFLAAADLDGDRNVDLVESPGGISVTWGSGGASFDAPRSTRVPGTAGQLMDLVDHDGDGDLEIAVASHGYIAFLEAAETAASAHVAWRLVAAGRQIVAFASGDFDLDGRRDLAFISFSCNGRTCPRSLSVLFDRGAAGPRETVLHLETLASVGDMEAGDLDGDGDLDLASVHVSCEDRCASGVTVFFNEGSGAFTARDLPLVLDEVGPFLEVLDIDTDGDFDIVTDGVTIYRNQGAGVFGEPLRIPQECCGLAAGDLDSDGDVDLFTSESVLRNVGGSTEFEVVRHRTHYFNVAGPEDLDADGHLDLVGSSDRKDGDPHLSLLVNDGTGRLEAVSWLRSPQTSLSLLGVRDIDGDGRPDIVAGSNGGFQVHWNRISSPIVPGDALDLDSDGGIDQCQPARFTRGDVTGDGTIDIADPISILLHLFLGAPEPGCLEAVDSNDDGVVELTDAVQMLLFLFQGGPPPSHPGPESPCGRDLDFDSIGCSVYPAC